jgi:predicted MFS family arabinose efflux permease
VRGATWPLLLTAFAVGVDAYIVAGVLPAIADDLQEPVEAVGLLSSAYNLPTALLAPVFGPFSDRRGRRTAMLIGLAIFSIAAGACAVAPTLGLLLVARAINGLGSAIIIPAAFAYAGDLPDADARDRTIAMLASSFPLATLLGLPLGAAAATLFGWRAAFLLIALIALLGAVLIRRLLAPDAPRTGPAMGYRDTYLVVLRNRRALMLMTVTFAWFLGPTGLFTFMGEFVHETYGVPAESAGLIYVVVGVVGVAAARLSGRLMATIGRRRAVLLGIGLFTISAVLLPLSAVALPATIVVFGVWSFGTWFGVPALQATIADQSSTARGTLLAFNSTAFSLAGVLGPIIAGAAIASGGWSAAGSVAFALGLGAFTLAWAVLPRTRPVASGATPVPAPAPAPGTD